MINAYDKIYLENARTSLGRMLDYAVYDMGFDLSEFWQKFLASPVSKRFALGDVSVLAGRSGVELALMVAGKEKDYPKPGFSEGRSREYWTGWALAYYQWKTCLPFCEITRYLSIDEIRGMYAPYHEMDIRQFCDSVAELSARRKKTTNLKRIRNAAGISQTQLAKLTAIPVRTIQQYEQGQKNINNARAEYLISLSRALYCDPLALLEQTHRHADTEYAANGILFEIKENEPNAVTYAAMEAAEKKEDIYGPFETVAELKEELNW